MWSIQSSIFYLLWPTFFKNRGTGFCARFYCSECPKSPYFSMVLRDSKYQVLLRYARMCNRFEITRNQVVRKGTWVRIPPAAPRRSKVRFAPTFFYSCGTKERHPPAPLLLLSDRDSLRWIRGRFLTGDEINISESVLFFARNLDIRRLPSFDRGKVDFPKSSDRTRDIFIPGRHMNTTFRYNVSCNALQML